VLRVCLFASWLLRRLAFELSFCVSGDTFRSVSGAMSEAVLASCIPPGGTVLDIGCGMGHWSRVATKYARRVVGIDYDPAVLRRARSLGVRTEHERIEYLLADVNTALPDGPFDLVLALHVIEHIDDADALLTRVLGMTTNLLVEVPDFAADPLNFVRHAVGSPYYSDADHVREYTLAALIDHLARNGWRADRWEHRHGSMWVLAHPARAATAGPVP
jgi:SAM-dependent methyltransferase